MISKLSRSILLAFVLLLLFGLSAAAQEGDPAEELQKELWCPICQGIRLDVCEQKVCQQMRDMIDEELAAGKSKEEVKAQFIELYGPVVLGEPPREGFNLLAWLVPVLLVVGGIILAGFLTWRWSRKPEPAPESVGAQAAVQTDDVPVDDEYLARVEREIGE